MSYIRVILVPLVRGHGLFARARSVLPGGEKSASRWDLRRVARCVATADGAARAALDSALRWREAEEIEIRLRELESTLLATPPTSPAAR
jgi:hypothetical protein